MDLFASVAGLVVLVALAWWVSVALDRNQRKVAFPRRSPAETEPPTLAHRGRPKPVWVRAEVLRLAALMPGAGCRSIAIAFCNLQYSRERKLEEEYAFKSSVSISLEPYQKLVAALVDKGNPTELSKYTEFIIQSVNRVFTSPTGPVFEGIPSEKNYAEKIIKAMGDVIEPVVKGLKR